MNSQDLREAAALMRKRAEALEGRRWVVRMKDGGYPQQVLALGSAALVAETYGGPQYPAYEGEHIASWDPAVALKVADLLDVWVEHDLLDSSGSLGTEKEAVLALARTYLGTTHMSDLVDLTAQGQSKDPGDEYDDLDGVTQLEMDDEMGDYFDPY